VEWEGGKEQFYYAEVPGLGLLVLSLKNKIHLLGA
jgi:hypothetical protein